MCFIQHCFICRPSNFTVSEDAGIEPRTVATLALAVRSSRSNLDLIHSRLDLMRFSRVVTNSEISFAAITGSLNPSLIMVATCRQVLHVDKVTSIVNCSKMAIYIWREGRICCGFYSMQKDVNCTVYNIHL